MEFLIAGLVFAGVIALRRDGGSPFSPEATPLAETGPAAIEADIGGVVMDAAVRAVTMIYDLGEARIANQQAFAASSAEWLDIALPMIRSLPAHAFASFSDFELFAILVREIGNPMEIAGGKGFIPGFDQATLSAWNDIGRGTGGMVAAFDGVKPAYAETRRLRQASEPEAFLGTA